MTQAIEERHASIAAYSFECEFAVSTDDGRPRPCAVRGEVLTQPLFGLALGLSRLAELSGTVEPNTKSASTMSEATTTARTHRCSLSKHATRAAMDEDGQFNSASTGGSSKPVTGSLRQSACLAMLRLELRRCQLPTARAPARTATGPDAASSTTPAAGATMAPIDVGQQAPLAMSAAGPAAAGLVTMVVGHGDHLAPTTPTASSSRPAAPAMFVCRTCAKGFATAVALGGHNSKPCGQLPHWCSKCRARFATKRELQRHRCEAVQPGACKQRIASREASVPSVSLAGSAKVHVACQHGQQVQPCVARA